MRPVMTLALLACLALSGYVATQSDEADDLAAASRDRRAGPASQPGSGRSSARALPAGAAGTPVSRPDADQALADALADALIVWQNRQHEPGLPAADALSRQAWASQQPPPPAIQVDGGEPPAPVAPPFPYAWVGRYLDPLPKAIIAGPAGTWVTASGDVLEGQWRIDAIDDRQMTLTYLPLGQSQTVAMK